MNKIYKPAILIQTIEAYYVQNSEVFKYQIGKAVFMWVPLNKQRSLAY